MSRTQLRLAGFAVVLAALFAGGYAVGDQFPTDDRNGTDDSDDHSDDHSDGHSGTDHGGTDPEAGVTP